MVNGFDVVPVGVAQERSKVPRMVRAFTRGAIVTASSGNPCVVEPLDRVAIWGLQRKVNAASDLPTGRGAVRGGHEQLVGPEKTRSLAPEGNTNGPEDRIVEPPTPFQILDDEVEVINQTPAVDLVGFHLWNVDRYVRPSTHPAPATRVETRSSVLEGLI